MVSIVIGAPNRRVADPEIKSVIHKGVVFVFIKPFAATKQGTITAEQINKDTLIDTHYGAIAANATEQSLGIWLCSKGTRQISEGLRPLTEGSAGAWAGQPRRQHSRGRSMSVGVEHDKLE